MIQESKVATRWRSQRSDGTKNEKSSTDRFANAANTDRKDDGSSFKINCGKKNLSIVGKKKVLLSRLHKAMEDDVDESKSESTNDNEEINDRVHDRVSSKSEVT